MAVISEVKCGRCDRRYSGFRSRCPYCGARRNKRGKHADEADNAKAKLIIGILLLVLLIAATMVLIFTSFPDNNEASNPTDTAAVTDTEPDTSNEPDVTDIEDTSEPSPSEDPTPSASAIIEIAEVHIIWAGDGEDREDVSLKKVGDTLKMDFKTLPETTDSTAKWETSDPDIFMVNTDGTVTATGKGSATLTCTIDGVKDTCIVRVKGA